MNFIINSPTSSIAFSIFNYPIRWYGVIFSFAVFFGVVCLNFLLKGDKNKEKILDFLPVLIIFSITGARIFYVLGDYKFYFKNPLEILMINHGGLSIFGAVFFGIFLLYWYSKKNNFSFLKIADLISVSMPLSQAIGRWGNYFNQEAFGVPYNGFAKLFVDYNRRPFEFKQYEYFHPAFLYESILDFLLFIVLFLIYKKCKNIKSGTVFSLYLILYSIIRLFVENIRTDSVLDVANTHIAKIIAFIILIFAISLILFIYFKKKKID